MGANFSRFFVESPGNTILAAHYNGEFDNILTNFTPAGMDDASVNVNAMRALADPGEPGSESLATSTEGELQRLRFAIKEIKGTPQWYGEPPSNLSSGSIPIGGIIPHYDFNGLISLPSGFLYCDGSLINDVDSPLDGETLPDLSNRYLVGFGTEGGGNIDTALWSATPVGNASHQVNLEHTHIATSPVHGHTINHTHEFDHTHSDGTLIARAAMNTTDGNRLYMDTTTSSVVAWNSDTAFGLNNPTSDQSGITSGVVVEGDTGSPDDNTTGGVSNPNTSSTAVSVTNANAGSTTQTVQPRSISVRFIMRIK